MRMRESNYIFFGRLLIAIFFVCFGIWLLHHTLTHYIFGNKENDNKTRILNNETAMISPPRGDEDDKKLNQLRPAIIRLNENEVILFENHGTLEWNFSNKLYFFKGDDTDNFVDKINEMREYNSCSDIDSDIRITPGKYIAIRGYKNLYNRLTYSYKFGKSGQELHTTIIKLITGDSDKVISYYAIN